MSGIRWEPLWQLVQCCQRRVQCSRPVRQSPQRPIPDSICITYTRLMYMPLCESSPVTEQEAVEARKHIYDSL